MSVRAQGRLLELQAGLARHSNEALMLEDTSGRIIAANERAAAQYACPLASLVGRRAIDLRVPGEMPKFDGTRRRIAAAGRLVFETEHQADDGRRFPVEVISQRVEISGEMFIHHTVRDLSVGLRDHQWQRLFFDLPFVGMAITSSATKPWISFNDEWCRMLGYDRERLESMTWTQVTHPEDLKADLALFEQVLNGEREGYQLVKRFLRADGSIMHGAIDVRCARKAGGGISYLIATIDDITPETLARRELELSRNIYATLSGTHAAVARGRDLTTLLDEVCRVAVEAGGIMLAAADRCEPDGTLRRVAVRALDPTSIEEATYASQGLSLDAVRTGRLCVANALTGTSLSDTWIGRVQTTGARSAAALPVFRNGRVTVVLSLFASEPDYFPPAVERLLGEFGDGLSYALESLQARADADAAAAHARELGERLRAIIDSSDSPVWMRDRSGRHLVANRAYAAFSNRPIEGIVGRRVAELTTPENAAAALAIDQQVFASGRTVQSERSIETPLGRRQMLITGSPVLDADDAVVAVAGVATDVTERVQAQAALAASERTYRELFDRHPTPMWVYDIETRRIVAVNEAAVRHYGYSQDEFTRLRLEDLRPAADVPRLMESLASQDAEAAEESAWRHRLKDGALIDVEIRSHGITMHGRRARLVMATDITARLGAERALLDSESRLRTLNEDLEQRIYARTDELLRAKEKAEESDRVKSMFLASVSHELRTPLNSIIGFSDLLLAGLVGPMSDEQFKQVGIINSSGRHLLALITDFLDISKIEAGALTLELQELDLNALVEHDVAAYRQSAQERGLRLEFHPTNGSTRVLADARRLKQVVDNLVSNAVKFTDAGRVTVATSVTARQVRLAVEDTGIGIEAAELQRLFEPFVRVEKRSKRPREGTGLGLAIARRLTKAMGGTIEAQSSPGSGSVFVVILPRVATR